MCIAPPTTIAPGQPLFIRPVNGLGDKLLDVCGFALLCRLTGHAALVGWAGRRPAESVRWGGGVYTRTYDAALVDLSALGVVAVAEPPPEAVELEVTARLGVAFSAPLLAATLGVPAWELPHLVDAWTETARRVRPGPLVQAALPPGLAGCTGVHLRRSDKVRDPAKDAFDARHEMTAAECAATMRALMQQVEGDLRWAAPYELLRFFVCSDEPDAKARFEAWLAERSRALDRRCEFVEPLPPGQPAVPEGYSAAVDLFCLSRCRRIYQGSKHSSFSVAAGLIGGCELHNFAAADAKTLGSLWAPCSRPRVQADAAWLARVAVAQWGPCAFRVLNGDRARSTGSCTSSTKN